MQKEQVLRSLFDYHLSKSQEGKINEFLKFLYKSRNHYLIILLLASIKHADKGLNYEEICTELNYQFASRTTILNILDDGVKLDFFIKKMDTQDHRKQNYSLNNGPRNIVYEWLENHPFNK